MKKFTYLSSQERSEIEILHNKGYSIRNIAKVLGRSPNTISLELKKVPSGYKATYAKIYTVTKLKNRRFQWAKIESTPDLKRYIVNGLKKYWNPDEISGRMKRENTPWYVSKNSIYRWLQSVRGERYQKYLYGNRLGRRHKKCKGTTGTLTGMIPIELRENSRMTPGNWESDLVVSCRSGSGGISTSVERTSRYLHAMKVKNQTAEEKQKTLQKLTEMFFVQSITFDRGRENAKHYELDVDTYFCNAYSSYEKGSVENVNKMIRRFFPKKTDFATISEDELAKVVEIINNKPRRVLDYATSTEIAREVSIIR